MSTASSSRNRVPGLLDMERLTLTARVDVEDSRYVARIEGIDVRGEGDSPDAAREELVQAMLSWISQRDCTDSMAGTLAEAGFPEIDDNTELELEFIELSRDTSVEWQARDV